MDNAITWLSAAGSEQVNVSVTASSFWTTFLAVAVGGGVTLAGQWAAGRQAAKLEATRLVSAQAHRRELERLSFRRRSTEGLQNSIRDIWRLFSVKPGRKGRGTMDLRTAFVEASGWRSRLDDAQLANEIKEWMEGVAAVCDDRKLHRKAFPSLLDQYRQLMERLGRQLSDLHSE